MHHMIVSSRLITSRVEKDEVFNSHFGTGKALPNWVRSMAVRFSKFRICCLGGGLSN